MKIKDQACSLELAKKLHELGVKQDSFFVWFKLKENDEWSIAEYWQIDDEERFDTISAFTVAELGEMLPVYIDYEKISLYEISIYVIDEEYIIDTSDSNNNNFKLISPRLYGVFYKEIKDNLKYIECDNKDANEANSRAKMLIYLIENGLLKHENIQEIK